MQNDRTAAARAMCEKCVLNHLISWREKLIAFLAEMKSAKRQNKQLLPDGCMLYIKSREK